MKKINVYLDMDGTIADLYGQENWLEMLIEEKDVHHQTEVYQCVFISILCL